MIDTQKFRLSIYDTAEKLHILSIRRVVDKRVARLQFSQAIQDEVAIRVKQMGFKLMRSAEAGDGIHTRVVSVSSRSLGESQDVWTAERVEDALVDLAMFYGMRFPLRVEVTPGNAAPDTSVICTIRLTVMDISSRF